MECRVHADLEEKKCEVMLMSKDLDLHIHQRNKHVQSRVIMIQSFKIKAQRVLLRKLKIIIFDRNQNHDHGYEQINISNVMWILCLRLEIEQTRSFHDPMPLSCCDGRIQAWNFVGMNYKKDSLKQKSKHVVWNTIIHINKTSWWFKSPSQHSGATTKGISPYKITKCV